MIDPPDGNMKHYIEALQRLREMNCDALLPGHGDRIDEPQRVIDWIIDHRLQREAKVLAALQANPGLSSHDLVPHVYEDVPRHLYLLAERSLLAHLLKLEADGVAAKDSDVWKAI